MTAIKSKANAIKPKSMFSSLTVNSGIVVAICAVVAAFSKSVNQDELLGVVGAGKSSIVNMMAIGTAVMAIISRVQITKFNVPMFKSKTFWYGVTTVFATGLSLFGGDIEVSDLNNIVDLTFTAAPEIIAFIASAGIVLGRLKADTPLVVTEAKKL